VSRWLQPRGIRTAVVAIATALLLCALSLTASRSGQPACAGEWSEVPRIIAFGDAHGSYVAVLTSLLDLGLVDEELAWNGGATHLVFNGDLLDRGSRERDLLDLVRRLQREAEAAGGRVHVLLGNHETMNLVGDYRYVPESGYATFADLEKPDDRRTAWKAFQNSMNGAALTKEQIRSIFDANHPPGYFGRVRAFGPGGGYGEWLLDQKTIIKINDVVFVHGGLTEEIAALGLEEINRRTAADLRRFQEQRAIFVEEGGIHPFPAFVELMTAAAAIETNPAKGRGSRIKEAAKELRGFIDSIVVSQDGPFWYRGTSLEDERVERDRFDESLERIGGRYLVVGHTPTSSGTIQSRFDGRLFRTDVGMSHGNGPQLLVFEDCGPKVFDTRSDSWVTARAEPPRGEGERMAYAHVSDLRMERHLETAKIASQRPLGRGGTRPLLLELNGGSLSVRGLFKDVVRTIDLELPGGGTLSIGDRYQNEVAAYRLDRMLGLGMVPVTVVRDLDGRGEGSLQLWIEGAYDRAALRTHPLPDAGYGRVELLLARARIFDALIGNMIRKDTDVLYEPEREWVYLVDHSSAFSDSTDLSTMLGEESCHLEPEMELALRALSRKELVKQLTPWVTKEQVRTVLVRRDALLKLCARPARPKELL
jgi:hypothetical protein